MAKVIYANPKPNGGKAKSPPAVSEKRIRGPDGKLHTLRTLDAGSRTFGEDFHYVFTKNVEKARRENKKLTGSRDGAPAKR